MMDRFVEGHVSRISPESPTPVFNYKAEEIFPGGAANVARNISAFGGACTLVGVVGHDDAAETLARSSDVRPLMVAADDRPTTVKTRFVVRGQHMLRVDQEVAKPITEGTEKGRSQGHRRTTAGPRRADPVGLCQGPADRRRGARSHRHCP